MLRQKSCTLEFQCRVSIVTLHKMKSEFKHGHLSLGGGWVLLKCSVCPYLMFEFYQYCQQVSTLQCVEKDPSRQGSKKQLPLMLCLNQRASVFENYGLACLSSKAAQLYLFLLSHSPIQSTEFACCERLLQNMRNQVMDS